jgi:hypothetical protein
VSLLRFQLSHEANGEIPEREYVDALIADLQSALPLIWGRPVVSVFFGGGTPSLLSPAAIDELLAAFLALAMLSPEAEITLEAIPVRWRLFAGSARPASIGFRSAFRVSVTIISRRSVASTGPMKQNVLRNWPRSILRLSILI